MLQNNLTRWTIGSERQISMMRSSAKSFSTKDGQTNQHCTQMTGEPEVIPLALMGQSERLPFHL
jgi:hypothetical protein